MKTHKKIYVSLDEAIKWFNSGNATLKEFALKAFSKDELAYNFNDITTFEKACEALGLNYDDVFYITKSIATISKASAAMFKLNIIRKAINLGQDLHLTKDPEGSYIYYPCNPFVTESSTYYESDINSGKMEIVGRIRNEGTLYNVLGGHAFGCDYAFGDPIVGLGYFYPGAGVGGANASVGYLGCANEYIAKHFGKYFGMLITESKYGDMIDFNIIEDKYGCTQ